MKTKRKKADDLTLAGHILLYLFAGISLLPQPFESKTSYCRRFFSGNPSFKSIKLTMVALERLHKSGLVTIYQEKNKPVIKLTKEGQLQALFLKAQFPFSGEWDGKWRIIIFDIPEEDGGQKFRDMLRFMLKRLGFKLVQKSVFINPYPLNTEAIQYLKETGLRKYIRVMKVEEIDDDTDIKKMFGLN